MISGDDAIALPIIALGGSGLISVTANAYPRIVSDMVSHALKTDMVKAKALHYELLDMNSALFEEGNPSGIKAMLEILKIAPNNLRLPLAPVSDKLYTKLEQLAKKIK